MKESIYTIPLTDAFSQTEGCPLCSIAQRLETDMVDYCVGPSMMEPDSREKSNKTGFCRRHLDMMLETNNRLSLALMLSTHYEYIGRILNETDISTVKGGLFRKSAPPDFSALINSTHSCVICEKVNGDIERYTETLFYMWDKKPEFRNLPGFSNLCLQHSAELSAKSPASCESLREKLSENMKNSIEINETELKAFIDMFDYRSKRPSPDAHKNALPDAIRFLRYK